MRAPFVFVVVDEDGDECDFIEIGRILRPSADEDPTSVETINASDGNDHDIDNAWEHLMTQLSKEHRVELLNILEERETPEGRNGPRFDLKLVQRYLVWRVFDLGWTIERFGQFDQYINWNAGRNAAKPERIGKKYQWIAYHEILAYLADHYQYRPSFTVDGELEDTWGLGRNISGTSTLRGSRNQ